MNDPLIRVEHLTYCYQGAGTSSTAALSDITLEIAHGSCSAIIGVTGSGKSTLVQHFNGLLRPTAGQVTVDGLTLGPHGTDDAAELKLLRQRVGLLFQFPEAQLFEQTVYADVAFGPRRMRLGRREVRARVIRALEMVGLPVSEYGWRSPFDLSGGQMRRVALAGVLAMTPKVLIVDEPTVGLDAAGRAEFYSYVRRLRQRAGVTLVLISHDMAEVAALADHLFVLHEGRLVLQGAPHTVFSQADALHTWGLAPPPLNELLARLRGHGLALPEDVETLDEAFKLLKNVLRKR